MLLQHPHSEPRAMQLVVALLHVINLGCIALPSSFNRGQGTGSHALYRLHWVTCHLPTTNSAAAALCMLQRCTLCHLRARHKA
jgi:hypothetical protein